MRHVLPLQLALCLCVCAGPMAAQLTVGDVGVTGFSTSQFSVIEATGGIQAYDTGGFGGGTSQSILWDPVNPGDFIVGGFNFVGRATVTGSGAVVWTPITTAVTAAQMSWDANGFILVADPSADNVTLVDPLLGTVTVVAPSGPWASNLNAGAINAATGDIVIGGRGGIWRIPAGSTVPTTIATSFGNNFVSGITFDPITGDVIAAILTTARLIRIDAQGNVSDVIPAGTLNFNSVTYGTNNDIIAGGTNGTVYRIPYAGGSLTPIGTPSGQSNNASGVAVVGMAMTPMGPQYQLNQVGATLRVNGIIGTALMPATVTVPPQGPMPSVVILSSATGQIWDVGIGTAPLRGFSQGVLSLPDGQLLNLDTTDPTLQLLWGGFQSPPFAPIIGLANVTGPQNLSLQCVIVDPASSTNISLSQPVRLIMQ